MYSLAYPSCFAINSQHYETLGTIGDAYYLEKASRGCYIQHV